MYESFLYNPDSGFKSDLTLQEIKNAVTDSRSVLWIDMLDIDDADIDLLSSVFSMHPLTVEDLIMPNARPKVEKFSNYLFLIMFSLEASPDKQLRSKIKVNELDCCLGRNFLITYHNNPINPLTTCKDRVKKQSPIIMQGADMLLYSVLDACIDSYFPIIQAFDDLVDEMSDELFKDPDQKTLQKIYNLKNDAMNLRRTIGPQSDVISLLTRSDFDFISPSSNAYFRNICDNFIRLNDVVGTSRDIITGAMEAHVSVVSNKLNEIMKTLTVIATTMMPLTLIASIYGMNFRNMPELESRLGYPAVIFAMFLITVFMLIYFKRKKWL
ncbi:MAG: magnesium/cobalt transporter CorA [Candidatus Omnitrophica bacterium]|nr:magnesium/cobalt transporter CorA [Candidatus Omnitrophota bacterium]